MAVSRRGFLGMLGSPLVRGSGALGVFAVSTPAYATGWLAIVGACLTVAEKLAKKGPNPAGSAMAALLQNQHLILDQLANIQTQLGEVKNELADLKTKFPKYIASGFAAENFDKLRALSDNFATYVAEDSSGLADQGRLNNLFDMFEFNSGNLRSQFALYPNMLSGFAMPICLNMDIVTHLRRGPSGVFSLAYVLKRYRAWIQASQQLPLEGTANIASAMKGISDELVVRYKTLEASPAFNQAQLSLDDPQILKGAVFCRNGQRSQQDGYDRNKKKWIYSYHEKFRLQYELTLTETENEIGYRVLAATPKWTQYDDWREVDACWHISATKYDGLVRRPLYLSSKTFEERIKKLDRERWPLAWITLPKQQVKDLDPLISDINDYRAQFAVHARALAVVQACADKIDRLEKYVYA